MQEKKKKKRQKLFQGMKIEHGSNTGTTLHFSPEEEKWKRWLELREGEKGGTESLLRKMDGDPRWNLF